jgi:plastocyanin
MRRLIMTLMVALSLPLAAHAATYTVTMTNYAFTPNDLSVNTGDTVHWVSNQGSHTVTATSSNWSGVDSGNIPLNGSFDYTFTTAGKYDYVCTYHESLGMTGTVRVASTSATPATWGKIKALFR